MYFYLRHHVNKINVIKANLNVIQYFFILKITVMDQRDISVPKLSRKLATGMKKF